MELEKIKELMDLMKANDLTEIEIVDGQSRIMLRRGPEPGTVAVTTVPQVAAPPAVSATTETEQMPQSESSDGDLAKIESPIVGTYYSAASPNADAFVKVGDHVDEDTVVCIIEAMKVMNEVKSEISGTIKKVLTENGQAVEFGQPLFLIEAN